MPDSLAQPSLSALTSQPIPAPTISVVTPTFRRAHEVGDLLKNISCQIILPLELILVDGAPPEENDTQQVVEAGRASLPYPVHYIRGGGGTAIQRNQGIDAARGSFIAFIDDDIRLEPDFFERTLSALLQDKRAGGVAGYITNQYLDPAASRRWQWYRRLKLFTTYEPGRYDYESGYPINRYLQPPHAMIKELDFMGVGCSLWRADVFASGLRFDEFFVGFGVMEDAQLSLRAKRSWRLLEYGAARCVHLHSTRGRESERLVARKTAVNHRYLFITIVPRRTLAQELRFWRVQGVQLLILLAAALRQARPQNWLAVLGKVEGICQAIFLTAQN